MDTPITRAEHNEYVRRMDDEHKRLNKRIDALEETSEQMLELIKNVGIMATNMEHMAQAQQDLNIRVEHLEDVPVSNFNTIKNGLLNAIGAAIGGAVIASLLYFL